MAAFEYVALDARGRRKKGVREGDSRRQVRQALRDTGLTPLSVDVAEEGARGSRWMFPRGMSALDQALFTRQVATMISAGLPVEEALDGVAGQIEKRRARAMIMTVRTRVREGHSLAAALSEFPSTFSDMYRSTVAAGEQSGHLDAVLENLADYTEASFESRRSVEMALFYPVVLLVFAILIVGALLIYIVPDIVKVFEDTGGELPLLTRFMIGLSEFLQSYVWVLLAGVVVVWFGIRRLLARPEIRLQWDRQKLSLPLLGRIARGGNASRYANTLSILTSSGVPLVEAMHIAAEVVSNQWLKRGLSNAVRQVSEGSSLRVALESCGHFPPMFLHMVASGESSGELDTMLRKVARFQQSEIERLTNALVRVFEPTMMVIMGLVVVMIVLAILLPILSIHELVA